MPEMFSSSHSVKDALAKYLLITATRELRLGCRRLRPKRYPHNIVYTQYHCHHQERHSDTDSAVMLCPDLTL
jgi:hypothetical protein